MLQARCHEEDVLVATKRKFSLPHLRHLGCQGALLATTLHRLQTAAQLSQPVAPGTLKVTGSWLTEIEPQLHS